MEMLCKYLLAHSKLKFCILELGGIFFFQIFSFRGWWNLQDVEPQLYIFSCWDEPSVRLSCFHSSRPKLDLWLFFPF